MTWTDDLVRYVLDTDACPRCNTRRWQGGPTIVAGACRRCGVSLQGEGGALLWAASRSLADAARERQRIIDQLPQLPPPPAGTAPPAVAAPPVARSTVPASAGSESTITLQSVLAVVGAALLAVAAIVFTFLNPELTDHTTRSWVIAGVTAAFLAGAWMLHRRSLRFSAEAVGALAMLFLTLDVWAVSRFFEGPGAAWFAGAGGLALVSGSMTLVGSRVGMRTWLWAGLVGLSVVPVLVAFGLDEALLGAAAPIIAWGFVGAATAAWALLELVRRLEARRASTLRLERASLTVIGFGAALLAVGMAFFAPGQATSSWPLVAVLGALALVAFLNTRIGPHTAWSVTGTVLVSGALFASAVEVCTGLADPWIVVGAALAAAVPLAAAGAVLRTASIHRRAALATAAAIAGLVVVPLVFSLLARLLLVLATAVDDGGVGRIDAEGALWAAAATAGLALIAGAAWSVRGPEHRAGAVAARWVGVAVVAGLPLTIPGPVVGAIATALGCSIAASVILLAVPRIARVSRAVHAPLVLVAHGAVLEAVILSWPDAAVASITAAAALVALALAARISLPGVRSVHTGIGFAYALVAGATALSLTVLEPLAILCLVAASAGLVAIATSVTSWLRVPSWYAVLGVATLPFSIAVAAVVSERSGWTALATGVGVVLATVLVATRRTGATRWLRTAAASVIVPGLAVVVVCLTAVLLPVSGSPYALPLIAAIVAIALPSTRLARDALVRAGHGDRTARSVQLAIEVSALVTGAIAVLLSLVRVAAGVEIALVVLIVIGAGAASSAIWLRRRYGWWTAAAAWTGALWCTWSLAGVAVVEPYLLPPAIAAIVVGTVLTAVRSGSRTAVPLVATGLATAILPTLALLAFGPGGDDARWRTLALIAAGIALVVVAGTITRAPEASRTRVEALRVPLLVASVVAASGGVVSAVQVGLGGRNPFAEQPPMAYAVALAIVAAATAAAAGRLARIAGARSGWLFAPALGFLVVGPMSAISPEPAAIWTLWGLELALLALLVVSVVRGDARPAWLPPVWFQWALAWCVAVAAWSPREVMRVEGFALPLGLALVAVGTIALRRPLRDDAVASLASWPLGHRGSWSLLGPGIATTLVPSMLATFTDPVTWRAILVIGIALVSVLVGARATLAAPFTLGIIALPIEILSVFLARFGTEIDPLLWWITLATAGLVLLVIAVGWERRAGADATLAARIRDLR